METGDAQYHFKETRLNLEPSSPASVVDIHVPRNSNGRGANRRPTNGDNNATDEEIEFRRKNLAAAASVFHREWHDSPRSFLWRILDDATVLSIRAVDVCREEREPDATLVLNFRFPVPIRPSCVAFADPKDHDALCVFVLDEANYLHYFTLRPDVFRKRSAIEAALAETCKSYLPPGFSFKSPHRLAAAGADVVIVTLCDGGLMRLDRNKTHNVPGQPWKETFFNLQSWVQGLKGLIPFQSNNTVRFGKVSMELSTATSVEVTTLGMDGMLFLLTVCVDHRMRIWNLKTGKLLYVADILNADRNPQEIGKWTIDPTQANLIRTVGGGVGRRVCATFSPIGTGEFKFWNIVVKNDDEVDVEDAFPDAHLLPLVPSASDVWTLADFVLSKPRDTALQLWALWKNNMSYKVQRLAIDHDDIDQSWESDWDSVYIDTSMPTAQTSGPCEAADTTEKWLQLILFPGRFTKSTLETAISIFERSVGSNKDRLPRGHKGLAESLCSVIAATTSLDRNAAGAMDFEQFRAGSEIQWRRFNRLLIELERQRGEALSLVLDPESDMTWVVCADILSGIRECSDLERLCYNLSHPAEGAEGTATLVLAGFTFLDGFSDNIWQLCNAILRSELYEDSSKTDYERIQFFLDKAGFWRGITEEDCAQVVDALGQNFEKVTNAIYGRILELMATTPDARSRSIRHPLTEFGRKLIVKAVQETVDLQWKLCFSQLVLLVHMEYEFDQEEDALHHRVDIGSAFRLLIQGLRRLELLRWMIKTEISAPTSRSERPASRGSPSASKRGNNEELQSITALEGNISHLLGFADVRNEPLASSITAVAVNVSATDSDIEVPPTLIQCALIKRERPDLALELTPFCDQKPFSVYIQGRVFLALKDYYAAAERFRKAAVGMSVETADMERHSSGLLDDIEWALLNKGIARYYCHIVAIFERPKAYSHVVDFARLAIQFASPDDPEGAIIRTELQSRLFYAAMAMSRFDMAHASLLCMKDRSLQQAALRKLVEKMCDTYHNIELISLPFPGLQHAVEDILEEKCKNTFDVSHGIPYHQILYSWRISHHNYRGAATVLYDRIQKLQNSGEGDKFVGEDVLDTPVTKQYLLLINALTCVDAKERWIIPDILARPGQETNGDEKEAATRKLVTLEDIRKQYQDELDRIAAIQNNQFEFEADGMEIL